MPRSARVAPTPSRSQSKIAAAVARLHARLGRHRSRRWAFLPPRPRPNIEHRRTQRHHANRDDAGPPQPGPAPSPSSLGPLQPALEQQTKHDNFSETGARTTRQTTTARPAARYDSPPTIGPGVSVVGRPSCGAGRALSRPPGTLPAAAGAGTPGCAGCPDSTNGAIGPYPNLDHQQCEHIGHAPRHGPTGLVAQHRKARRHRRTISVHATAHAAGGTTAILLDCIHLVLWLLDIGVLPMRQSQYVVARMANGSVKLSPPSRPIVRRGLSKQTHLRGGGTHGQKRAGRDHLPAVPRGKHWWTFGAML